MRGGDHPGILASFRLSELTPEEIRDATKKLITDIRAKYDEVRLTRVSSRLVKAFIFSV